MTVTDLQLEISEWSKANFGQQPSDNPLKGISEELGEMIEATKWDDVLDGAADMMIFAMDFCGRIGWSMARCIDIASKETQREFSGREVDDAVTDIYLNLAALNGRLNRSILKIRQGIRVGETHQAAGMVALGMMWHYLEMLVGLKGENLLDVVRGVWVEVVKKRNWEMNNIDGRNGQVPSS